MTQQHFQRWLLKHEASEAKEFFMIDECFVHNFCLPQRTPRVPASQLPCFQPLDLCIIRTTKTNCQMQVLQKVLINMACKESEK